MRRNYSLLCLYVVGILFLYPSVSFAQSIQVNPNSSVATALQALSQRSSIQLVFANEVVAGKTTSCRYRGNSPTNALTCILSQTGLTARKNDQNQWIIGPAHTSSVSESIVATKTARITPQARIVGKVTDSQTQEPLVGAHIYLTELRKGAITDEKGAFQVPNLKQGIYETRISFLGYEPLTLLINTQRPQSILLKPIPLESISLLVEESRKSLVKSMPGAVTLSQEVIDESTQFQNQEDLFQVLQTLPSVHRTAEANGELTVRGSEDGQNLYLLDGVPLYQPPRTFGHFSSFQTDLIKNVTLYKGAMPAEFGGRLSSVLNAELRDGKRTNPSAMLGVSTFNRRLMIESPVGELASMMVAYRTSRNDEETINVLDQNREIGTLDANYKFRDVTAKVTLQPNPRHTLSSTIYYGTDNLDYDSDQLMFQGLSQVSGFTEGRINSTLQHHWQSERYSLQYRYLHSANFMLNTIIYQTGYALLEDNRVSGRDVTQLIGSPTNSIAGTYQTQLQNRGIDIEADHYLSPQVQTRAGVQVINYNFNSNLTVTDKTPNLALDIEDKESTLNAVESLIYVENTWRPHPSLEVKPGVRLGSFNSYLYVTPRLFASYMPTTRLKLNAGLSTQVQHIHWLRDRFSLIQQGNELSSIASGTMHIQPAKGIQYAGGVEAQILNNWHISADVYWRRFENVLLSAHPYRLRDGIEEPWIEASLNPQYYTSGNSKAYGIELATNVAYNVWQLSINYTWSRSLYQIPEQIGFLPARFDTPHALRTIFGWQKNAWSVSLNGEIRSGFPTEAKSTNYKNATTNLFSFLASNTERLPLYRRIDTQIGYQFDMLGLKWKLEGQIFNLTNYTNQLDRIYLIGQTNPNPFEGEGRQVMFNVKVIW